MKQNEELKQKTETNNETKKTQLKTNKKSQPHTLQKWKTTQVHKDLGECMWKSRSIDVPEVKAKNKHYINIFIITIHF